MSALWKYGITVVGSCLSAVWIYIHTVTFFSANRHCETPDTCPTQGGKPKISINYTWRSTALEKVCEIGKTNFSLAIVQMSAAFFSVGLLVFEKLMSILVHGNWIISILLVNQQTNVVSGFNRACKVNVPDHRHVDYKSKLLWAEC